MLIFRRRFITVPRYQFRFTLALLRGFAIAVLIPAVVLFASFFLAVQRANPTALGAVASGLPAVIGFYANVLAAFAFGTVLLGVYLSHKCIGPLRRIEAWSGKVLLGTPCNKLVLRPGDELIGVTTRLTDLAKKSVE